LSLVSCKQADKDLEIKVYALNGTTALGMAQMIDNAKNDTDEMNYNISLHKEADAVTGAILTGECAIAALPTNVAAKLYKKSEGKVQLLALNTLGVLYLLDTTNKVKNLSDLEGKTVYLPGSGSNPEYITAAIIKGAGLKNVTLDTTSFTSPDALQTAIIGGLVEYAVLPEPKVSVVTTKKQDVSVALNLTDEWEKIYGENTLVQGCLVVNKAFADEHPAEIKKFLEDYKASVEFISAGSDEAINMITGAEILPSAAIAKKALPKCNICYIDGNDMKNSISVFYEKLYAVNPASIAAIPDSNFYYIAK
jgi:NitT/TauT family transport system substrate-binding protein